jgi:hypothetical protein
MALRSELHHFALEEPLDVWRGPTHGQLFSVMDGLARVA